MNSSSYDPHTSPDITHMSETILDSASNQALVTTNDIDILNDATNFSSGEIFPKLVFCKYS